jgi:hypothetical protein
MEELYICGILDTNDELDYDCDGCIHLKEHPIDENCDMHPCDVGFTCRPVIRFKENNNINECIVLEEF